MPESDYAGGQVVPSKSEVGDANVIKDKAKLVGASHKLLICPGADLNMTLCDLKLRNSNSGPIIDVPPNPGVWLVSKSTCSLIVISSPASNSATTCFSTSLVMEGSTCLSRFYFFLLLDALIIGFQSNTNINHPVVIILTKGGVNLWKGVRLRPEHSNDL